MNEFSHDTAGISQGGVYDNYLLVAYLLKGSSGYRWRHQKWLKGAEKGCESELIEPPFEARSFFL